MSFAERCGLHTPEREAACQRLERLIAERGIQRVRVGWCDAHGLLRGKTITHIAADYVCAGTGYLPGINTTAQCPNPVPIGDDEIRFEFLDGIEGAMHVFGSAGDGEIFFLIDHFRQPLPYDWMIVHQEDAAFALLLGDSRGNHCITFLS